MQIGEQHLPALQLLALLGERFLHLDDHLGTLEQLSGARHDFGTCGKIVVIAESGTETGARLDEDTMSLARELLHSRGNESDAMLVIFDFFGDPDQHAHRSLSSCARYRLGSEPELG
jgi:hypothetical protein